MTEVYPVHPTHADAKRRLRRAVYGPLDEWRKACEYAYRAGMTEAEVKAVLVLYHPSTWMLVAFGIALVTLIGYLLGTRT